MAKSFEGIYVPHFLPLSRILIGPSTPVTCTPSMCVCLALASLPRKFSRLVTTHNAFPDYCPDFIMEGGRKLNDLTSRMTAFSCHRVK